MNARKAICLDEVSMRFLHSLKFKRKKLEFSQQQLGELSGIKRSVISDYETGRMLPAVGNLVKLAEVLGYDLSTSVNYKYYHGLIDWQELKERLVYFGFTFRELGSYLGYHDSAVSIVFSRKHGFSLTVLSRILEIFEDERRMLKFRNELLRRKTPSRREWWKRTKSPARPNSGSREIWQWPF